jgi:hypothetical protein
MFWFSGFLSELIVLPKYSASAIMLTRATRCVWLRPGTLLFSPLPPVRVILQKLLTFQVNEHANALLYDVINRPHSFRTRYIAPNSTAVQSVSWLHPRVASRALWYRYRSKPLSAKPEGFCLPHGNQQTISFTKVVVPIKQWLPVILITPI